MPRMTDVQYRSDDFSILLTVETSDPFEQPQTVQRDGVTLHILPKGTKEGWQFRQYKSECGQVIEQLVQTNKAPESFIRDQKTFVKVANGCPTIGAPQYGKPDSRLVQAMDIIKSRLPKNKENTISSGRFF